MFLNCGDFARVKLTDFDVFCLFLQKYIAPFPKARAAQGERKTTSSLDGYAEPKPALGEAKCRRNTTYPTLLS